MGVLDWILVLLLVLASAGAVAALCRKKGGCTGCCSCCTGCNQVKVSKKAKTFTK